MLIVSSIRFWWHLIKPFNHPHVVVCPCYVIFRTQLKFEPRILRTNHRLIPCTFLIGWNNALIINIIVAKMDAMYTLLVLALLKIIKNNHILRNLNSFSYEWSWKYPIEIQTCIFSLLLPTKNIYKFSQYRLWQKIKHIPSGDMQEWVNFHNSSTPIYFWNYGGAYWRLCGGDMTICQALRRLFWRKGKNYCNYGGSCLCSQSPLKDRYGNIITPSPCPDHFFCI